MQAVACAHQALKVSTAGTATAALMLKIVKPPATMTLDLLPCV